MRVVVIGAGIIGACVALELVNAGVDVIVLDRGQVGSGTTSRGEGNILLSDKAPGPELDLAKASRMLWGTLAEQLGADRLEFEAKGGLVVATSPRGLEVLHDFVGGQVAEGVVAERADGVELRRLEPWLSDALPGGMFYPQDAQVQPVLAAAAILAAAVRGGAQFRAGVEVVGAVTGDGGTVTGVRTVASEIIGADAIVNATGTWGQVVGERLGVPIPVLPRRGFILVTEPMSVRIHHKVYSADYVDNVAASTEGLETSCVVESTQGGTILIGASRERVGFDTTMDPEIVRTLAQQAVALFPFLARAQLMRVYRGFRPYCPDHLPVIGADPRAPGILHACGHEGAGIGLAPATGQLVAAAVTGSAPVVDPTPFLPDRLLALESP